MPVKKSDFYVNKYSDAELHTLLEAVQDEIAKREDARKRKREEWIYHYSDEAYLHGDYIVVGDTVVVAVEKNWEIKIAKTHPINGDKFDLDTGVAVAYAKAIGLRIPDFI